jgi:hypothetical protein
MKNLRLMTAVGELLVDAGLRVITPVPDEPEGDWSAGSSLAMKRAASRRHMSYIRDRETEAILVVNTDRNGSSNYVGPNSFAEISVAFADDRRIFLLQGMPTSYAEELEAWGVECLDGDLNRFARALGSLGDIDAARWRSTFRCVAV